MHVIYYATLRQARKFMIHHTDFAGDLRHICEYCVTQPSMEQF